VLQHSAGTWDNLFRGAALGVEVEGPCDGNQCRRQGRTGRDSASLEGLARVGLIAYGVVYS
jgi:hypothetical protein